jgi:hypothetical protein
MLIDNVTFRALAAALSLLTIIIDIKYFYPDPWHRAFTHWSFVAALATFAAPLIFDLPGEGQSHSVWFEALRAVAWGGTITVNVFFWGSIYPSRLRQERAKGVPEAQISVVSPTSAVKHGGSALWLLGDALGSINAGAIVPALTFGHGVAVGAWAGLYLLFVRWWASKYGEQLYNGAFQRPKIQVGFVAMHIVGLLVVGLLLGLSADLLRPWFPPLSLAAMPVYAAMRWRDFVSAMTK